jgi:hypothetical protein
MNMYQKNDLQPHLYSVHLVYKRVLFTTEVCHFQKTQQEVLTLNSSTALFSRKRAHF